MLRRITITIETGNAAFDNDPAAEAARILRDLAGRFDRAGIVTPLLYDVNGNYCGSITIQESNP
jgi:hypothetical protein